MKMAMLAAALRPRTSAKAPVELAAAAFSSSKRRFRTADWSGAHLSTRMNF